MAIIANVQFSDRGTHFCAWAIRGTDAYQEVQVKPVLDMNIKKQ